MSAAAVRFEGIAAALVCSVVCPNVDPNSTPVRLANEAAAVACRLGGPATRYAPAENRWTQHGAFETGTPVDVATGHACDLACGIEPGDRFEVLCRARGT